MLWWPKVTRCAEVTSHSTMRWWHVADVAQSSDQRKCEARRVGAVFAEGGERPDGRGGHRAHLGSIGRADVEKVDVRFIRRGAGSCSPCGAPRGAVRRSRAGRRDPRHPGASKRETCRPTGPWRVPPWSRVDQRGAAARRYVGEPTVGGVGFPYYARCSAADFRRARRRCRRAAGVRFLSRYPSDS